MSIDEKVYTFSPPDNPNHISGIGVPLDCSQDLCGLFFDFPKIVAPSIHMQEMAQAYASADYRYWGNGFTLGFVTNMRLLHPGYLRPLEESYKDYKTIQTNLLEIRASRPGACLEFRFDTKRGCWVYEKFSPEVPLDISFSTYEGE